jgi:hypothetical protein
MANPHLRHICLPIPHSGYVGMALIGDLVWRGPIRDVWIVTASRAGAREIQMTRRADNGDITVRPYDHFLYLLFEMEKAIQRDNIIWPDGQPHRIQDRLAEILRKLGKAQRRRGRHP